MHDNHLVHHDRNNSAKPLFVERCALMRRYLDPSAELFHYRIRLHEKFGGYPASGFFSVYENSADQRNVGKNLAGGKIFGKYT
jgi:hypothetical protein